MTLMSASDSAKKRKLLIGDGVGCENKVSVNNGWSSRVKGDQRVVDTVANLEFTLRRQLCARRKTQGEYVV